MKPSPAQLNAYTTAERCLIAERCTTAERYTTATCGTADWQEGYETYSVVGKPTYDNKAYSFPCTYQDGHL